MTFEEAVALAENGDIGAMISLGDYYIHQEEDKDRFENAAKWYEMALSILIFVFYLIWGTVPALCLIFPVIGGGLGGLLYAAIACFMWMCTRPEGKRPEGDPPPTPSHPTLEHTCVSACSGEPP